MTRQGQDKDKDKDNRVIGRIGCLGGEYHDVVVIRVKSVTVEDPPISFSPFSSTDCTMLSHFSFNDFIAVAFPDLARDLDVLI